MSGEISIEAFEPGGPRMRAFDGVRAPAEPVSRRVHCLLLSRDGEPAARCSLGVAEALHGSPGRSGLIGHYEALDAESGVALLRHASAALAEHGVARVLGPMNGGTWYRYRLALRGELDHPAFDPPTFLGEPTNPFEYPEHFAAAGFAIAARYESRIEPALTVEAAAVAEAERRLGASGFTLRRLDPERFDAEVDALFELSLEAFSANLYYAPIGIEEFRGLYQRFRGRLDPALVLLAHDGKRRPAGVLFGYPDSISDRGSGPTRAIVKTVAVSPAARGRGLGDLLLDRWRLNAVERGFSAAIHALMLVSNASMKMSSRHRSEIFRRYALFEWTP